MRIRHVNIENFRGIQSFDWSVDGDYVCLVGPGDSTKTTILDAIDCALSPRWKLSFDDSDFYQLITDDPISIVVTVGDLPGELLSDARFGFHVRGWSHSGELHDEPAAGDELVLSIELRVDASLEPLWLVKTDRDDEPKRISAQDREKFDCLRVGEYLDRHFSWSKGSFLSRITAGADGLASILANSSRAARKAFAEANETDVKPLQDAAKNAQDAGEKVGVGAKAKYRPDLDVQALDVGHAALSLHDGKVPVRCVGLGSRRLLSTAMQCREAENAGITLIDEVEYGLDPHRLRRLLRVLQGTDELPAKRQVFLTTHSPIALAELTAKHLRVVRSANGHTRVLKVGADLQRYVRKASEAFLGTKTLVCEGRTELGLCRCLDSWWSRKGPSFGLSGVALADGGGSDAGHVVAAFAALEYDTAFVGDSDRPLQPDREYLESKGATILLWDGGMATEERIAEDLPRDGLVAMIELAVREYGMQAVADKIAFEAGIEPSQLSGSPRQWLDCGVEEGRLRRATGAAAKSKGWFKMVGLAEELGAIICQRYDSMKGTPLRQTFEKLKEWAHGHE